MKVKILNTLCETLRDQLRLEEAASYAEQTLALTDEKLFIVKDSASKFILKKGKAKAFNILGSFHAAKKNFTEGRNYHYKAAKIQKDIGALFDLIDSYHRIGNCHRLENAFDQALKSYHSELEIATELNDKRIILQAVTFIANTLDNIGNLSESLKYSLLRLKLSEELQDKRLIAGALDDLGLVYQGMGKYDEAIKKESVSVKLFEEILKSNKSARDTQALADCYHNLGNAYSVSSEAKSLEYYFKALKLRELQNNQVGVGIEYSAISTIFRQTDKLEESLQYANMALEKLKASNSLSFIADCYFTIGMVQETKENYPEALNSLFNALEIRKKTQDKRRMFYTQLEIGNVYWAEKKQEQALKMYLDALTLSRDVNDNSGTAYVMAYLGRAYSYFPDSLSKAKQYTQDALEYFKKENMFFGLSLAYNILSQINSYEKNFEDAYKHYKLHSNYNDSSIILTNEEKVLRLQAEFEFTKKEDSLKFQQSLIDEKLKQQTLLSEQQQQSLLLKENELSLMNKESEIQRLAYLQTQSELQLEQSKRTESEKELQLASQEKDLQKNKIDLQTAELQLKNKNLEQQRTQRNIFITGSVALLLLAFFIFRNYQNQRKANKFMQAAAEKQMVELQLENLRAQLNPHFMFNSLNAIQELIVTDKTELSQSYLERFAKLLRMLLENANQPFIPLRKEINFLQLYLSLENLRIPDLKYSIKIDPQVNTETTVTPNMMLQPYIENALWHGLQHKQGEKKLELNISRENGSINYEIRDNGVGRKKSEELKGLYRKEHRSKGMELLSKRFSLLSKEYGKDIITEVNDINENGNAYGTIVKISVPTSLTQITQHS